MENPLYAQTVTIGGDDTTYNAPKVLGIRIHADQSFDLQYTFVKSDLSTAFDIVSSTSQIYVTAYKNVSYTPVLLASGVNTDSGSGTTDRVTFTVPAEAIPNDIANFPIRNPGNAVFYAIITDGAGKKIEVVAEVNIFDTEYSLTGDAAPSAQTIVPIKNDLGSVISSNLTTPPTATLNNAYIVGASATGDWSGQDNDLAIGTGSAWVFLTPLEGNFVYDENQTVQIIFDGSTWASLAGSPFTDADPLIKNAADATKLIGFDASAITTGTERTITMPDADVDLTPGTGSFATAAEGDLAATALQNIVEDTTPQLGGNLDAQDNRISSLLGIGAKTATVLDIATGAITQTQMIHNVGTEAAAAADDLDSIVPATGQTEIYITMNDAAEVPTIKHATGTNTFLLPSDTDILMVMNTFYHFHYDGTNWKLVGSSAAGGAAGGSISVGVWQDQKSNGTNGGSAASGSFAARTLNTEVSDIDSIGTLSANAVTLISGTYWVTASAPARNVSAHRIYINDGTSNILIGSNGYTTASSVETISVVSGVLIADGVKSYTIKHDINNSQATNGLGTAVSSGEFEGYAIFTAIRLGD